MVLLCLAACDARCAGPSATAESSPPGELAVEAPEPVVATPARRVRVTADDVKVIEHGELRLVDAPPFEPRKLPKPKVLMEGKHLRLPDEPWPLAPNRGFVLVQDGPDYDSPVLEARLLDLDTGEVLAVLKRLHRGSYTKLGVAFGQAEVGGVLHDVVVHASDGQVVLLWPHEQAKPRWWVVNAGTGQAWVFEQQREVGDGQDDAHEGKDPPYRLAYWPDLRKPPPPPTEPFWHWLDDGHRPDTERWLGPTWLDPAEAPLFLPIEFSDECKKVELRPDGYRCTAPTTWAMAGGWRAVLDEETEQVVMQNTTRGEEQVLELGKSCKVEEVVLDPPRALVRCVGSWDRYLWSPEWVVRVPEEVLLGSDSWSRNRHVREIERHSFPEDAPIATTWLDVVAARAWTQQPVFNRTPYSMGQYVVYTDPSNEMFVLDLGAGQAHPFKGTTGCADVTSSATALPLFAFDCRDGAERRVWLGILELEHNLTWRGPSVRESWLRTDPRQLIGTICTKTGCRIVAWDLE